MFPQAIEFIACCVAVFVLIAALFVIVYGKWPWNL